MENENAINKRVYDFTQKVDVIQTILVYLIALLVPTFLGEIIQNVFGATSVIASNSQIIIGSTVNTALIMTAINLKGWGKTLGVITMPSIATILGGYVFGTSSTYLVYMIPAIWLGNFTLVYSYKFFMLAKEKNYFLAGVVGVIVKVLIIYGCFSILNVFNIFPEKIVSTIQVAMSTTQLITATIGVIISFVIYKIEISSISKSKVQ